MMMITALNMTAESTADCGVFSPMILSTVSCGNAPANIAGMIAKYFATSLATEKVVRAPRVISNCLPITRGALTTFSVANDVRSEEHTSELQSRTHLVCRLLLDTKE